MRPKYLAISSAISAPIFLVMKPGLTPSGYLVTRSVRPADQRGQILHPGALSSVGRHGLELPSPTVSQLLKSLTFPNPVEVGNGHSG
jgi:hypothetical protein